MRTPLSSFQKIAEQIPGFGQHENPIKGLAERLGLECLEGRPMQIGDTILLPSAPCVMDFAEEQNVAGVGIKIEIDKNWMMDGGDNLGYLVVSPFDLESFADSLKILARKARKIEERIKADPELISAAEL